MEQHILFHTQDNTDVINLWDADENTVSAIQLSPVGNLAQLQ